MYAVTFTFHVILSYAVLLIESKDQEGQSQVLSAALEVCLMLCFYLATTTTAPPNSSHLLRLTQSISSGSTKNQNLNNIIMVKVFLNGSSLSFLQYSFSFLIRLSYICSLLFLFVTEASIGLLTWLNHHGIIFISSSIGTIATQTFFQTVFFKYHIFLYVYLSTWTCWSS